MLYESLKMEYINNMDSRDPANPDYGTDGMKLSNPGAGVPACPGISD